MALIGWNVVDRARLDAKISPVTRTAHFRICNCRHIKFSMSDAVFRPYAP